MKLFSIFDRSFRVVCDSEGSVNCEVDDYAHVITVGRSLPVSSYILQAARAAVTISLSAAAASMLMSSRLYFSR